MKRVLFSFVLMSTVVVLAGCNGTISSVSFPAAAPWQDMATSILSPTDDLVAVSTGAGVESALVPGFIDTDLQAIVTCKGTSNDLHIETCTDRACNAQTVCGNGAVIAKWYAYTLFAHLDRDVFTTGSVQIQNGSGATEMGLAINAGGSSFDVAAGFSQGLIDGIQVFPNDPSELGSLILAPHWSDFGDGDITGQVCSGGVCSTGTIAECDAGTFAGDTDVLAYLTTAQPGTYSGTCGTVPINLTINPPYASVGACISQRQATCSGLTGQNRKTCNHAQIGVCLATFNVPSALNH